MFSDFFIIEGWRSKHIQIFQATTLQQLGHGTFQCYAKIRMRTERGKAGTVSRIEQYHANHRILAAKRTVISEDWGNPPLPAFRWLQLLLGNAPARLPGSLAG